MTEKNSDAKAAPAAKTAKPRKPAQDVDAMVTEVAAAAKVKAPKAAPAEAKTAPKATLPEAKAAPKAAPKAAEPRTSKTIVIRQVRSGICTPVDQKLTLQALGLRRIRHEVTRPDTAAVRGLVRKVRHLVVVVGE